MTAQRPTRLPTVNFARPNLMNHLTENLVDELANLPEAAAFLATYQIALI